MSDLACRLENDFVEAQLLSVAREVAEEYSDERTRKERRGSRVPPAARDEELHK